MNRILVVDDSLSVRKVLERLLSAHAEVSVAVNAEDALKQLEAGTPMPDLLISDVLMPGMGGLELAHLLKARADTSGLPVILISGVLDDQLTLQAQGAGVRALIRKPFTAEELLPVILEVMTAPASTVPLSVSTAPQVAVQTQVIRQMQVAGPKAERSGPTSPGMDSGPVAANPSHLELLTTLMQKPGVLGVMVATQDGVVIGADGKLHLPAADLAMYARFFSSSATVLGKRLGSTDYRGMQLDFSPHTLLILPLSGCLLVCLLADANSSSMIRFVLRRHLNEPVTA